MVRETHNVCFGQIAQETQVAVKEDTTAVKRDHLKRSTDELSISNYTERNSGYYERSSRLVADTDSYIRRPNHSTSVINNYQTSSNSNINNSASINSNSDSNNNNNNRNRTTRDCRLYRNGPYAISSRTASPSTVLLSDRSVSVATSNNTNSRVPPASWYEATATYTNGPGGSGNAGVSAAGNPATSYSNSPAHNNSATATAISLRNHSSVYGNVTSALALDSGNNNRAIEISNILSNKGVGNNSSKYQRLLKLSSAPRSGSASPTTITGPATMTASSLSATTATKSSCSSFSSTINSNTNNNNLSSSISSVADTNTTASNASGILNAAALAAAAVSESNEVQSNNINTNTNNTGNNNINSLSNASNSSNNPSSASHHTSRSVAHAHLHGRSTTSSSRSHSRSPSSYSSSHSSSSSSSSASSNSHASSPTAIRDVDNSLSTSRVGPRSLQSAVAVPNSTIPSALNTSGCSIGGNGNSNNSSSGTPIGNPVVHSEDNRPLAIRVRNLPARSSDTSLKDGLFHEYKKHGKVTWVKVVGQNAERYALVCFKKPEDVEKALEVSHDKLFFGCKIEVEPYQGYDVEDNEFRPYEAELDEYHPKSTRTLFIGNLEKDITASELRSHFECFGEIIEIDIKKQGTSAYAFCQYSDIVSVVKAMRKMDGEHLGNNRIKLGFGKSMPTNCVWIDGIAEKISESHLQSQFSRYGAVSKVVIDRLRQLALVLYEQIQYAQTAVKEMRGATLRGRKLQVDFASRECQDAFYDKLDKQTASSRFNRYDSQSRSRASSFSRHQNSNDGCSPSNTPGSSSSSSAGGGTAPALPSAIVTNSMSTSFAMGPLSSVVGQTSGNSTPARSRGSRSSRHTMDYDYLDSRRFRSYDEYSQGSGASHDEDAPPGAHIAPGGSYSGIGLRSDSPLLSRLGPIVNSNKEPNEVIEVSLSSRRRCDKSPGKQKGDIRIFQKERSHLLEQLEECPSSGDENIVSPRKRIKIDHHSINSNCGLSQPHMLDEQPQHKNSNCDYILHDSIHRKGEVRRLSECSNLSKYPQQTHHHHHSHHSLPHHHHHQQQLSRRPSIDILATGGSLSARHGSTSSTSSNSDHHPPPYQSSTSLPCKRRRIISGSGNVIASNTLVSTSGTGLAPSLNDDYHHHASRGRGHQLHSQHSHEASGGESADGSRPGTPLCDERPEVLPSEPRRVPRDRPREPMVLPLPKFGIHFFQQYRNSMTSNSSSSLMPSSTTYHHHGSSSFTSASAASSTASGSSHILSNSLLSGGGGVSNNNVHSSLSHSFSTATSASSVVAGSSGSYLPSPPTRFPAQWRPHHHHQHHNHGHHGQQHHHTGTTPSSSSSAMISPLRSRSLSSNSSDSDVPGQSSTGSPSLEERIRTLDEMYERWSGGGATSNVIKRHDFNHAPPIWQQNRSVLSADLHHSNSNEIKLNAPSVPASRHKFLDIDVNELQPSEIVKSVLAKKSIFDDDLQRLKKNHWYEPSSDISQLAKNTSNICTSPGLPNLAATKAPVVGCTSNVPNSTGSTLSKPPGGLLQRLSSVSPMNSPQTSMSPYNSPSPSPSITGNVQLLSSITKVTSYTGLSGAISHPPTANSLTSLNSGASSKGLQYPFPSHPPLPSTAAPVEIQPQVPPSSSSTEIVALSKPKTSALSKSLSVPTTSTGPESRVLTKSVSVPGSTNVGTIKVTTPSTPPLNNAQYTSGISSSNATSNISNNKLNMEDNVSSKDIKSSSSSISSSLASTVKRDKSHKHNHRSSDDKKSMKSERNAEKRKSSNASLSQIAASAAESSDGDDKDLDKSFEKIKQDRDKSDKLQKERQEKRDKEQRKQQEREEKSRDSRVRDEREEKDRIEKERVENERLHRERLQRERLDKERIEQEGKERKQKEIEQETRERKEREENERRKREEREREEQLQREKERKIRDERKLQEDHTDGKAKDHHRKKVSGFQLQSDVTSDVGALNQSTQNLFRHDEIEQQNKENSAADPLCGSINHTSDNVITKSGKHRSRKASRNASPIRNPKRRLSSQDSNASICGVNTNNSHADDYTKRVRIENQVSGTAQPHTNNPNSINSKVNERHDFKEQNTKEKVAKHQRQSSSSSHKGAHANEKELNSTSSKYHRNKQQKEKQLQTPLLTQHSGDSIIVAPEHESEIPPTNCINRTEADNHLEQETSMLKMKPSSLQSSDEEGPAQPETPPTIKTPSNIRKHKEHGSGNGVSGHHSRHKGNKREREHHREKKRHSISLSAELLSSTISLGCCNATEEEMITANASNLQRRTSAHNATYIEMNTKCKHDSLLRSAERKTSRCSDDGPVGGQQPQTPSNRQSNHGKNHHIARRMLLSSAEDSDDVADQADENDDDDSDAATKKTSIFDIPDEGPYVSMYDKVKARSCKNMQKQEEEKKIKAKFSQLKQSRAKREEKKRSASYDGDTDSDLDGTESQNRHLSRGGGVYKSPRVISGGLSSTDDDRDQEQNKLSERERRLESQGSLSAPSVHPNRLYSASDNDSEEQRHLKLQDNIRRLYDGDESSEDELIRRNFNPNFHTNKRLGHHTSRIASDSESQSQSAIDTKFKQEPFDTSADEVSSSPLTKHCQKQFKKEIKNSETLCSMGVKAELNPKDHEIKKEFKELFADNYDKLQPDIKFHKSSVLCSPEVIKVKKHKKSKKRQKTPTHDNFVKDTITDTDVKGSPNSNIIASPLLSLQTDTKNLKILTSPCYDAFDELKRGGTLIAHTTSDISTFSEKKRHKDRKEKRREKLRHLNADVNTAIEADKIAYEKEKHRLKKSKRSKNTDAVHQNTQMTNIQMTMAAPDACFPFQHKKSGGEKMEDIFGPISDDDDEDVESQFTDSDIGPRDLNCLSARTSSTTNTPGPIVSAALNPYKQEPLTPKSHTVEENEENKQKLCSISASSTPHLERMLERQHRKERRERKRKDREKSRGSELHHNFASAVPSKNVEDENSVDLDAAGRALEAQLMEDSDNKAAEDATPSTATTYRSDMTDVFRFSDGDENSIELETSSRQERRDADKEHFNQSAKTKEKKKKKKRSKEEKQSHHHQRRESSSSNNSQQAYSANIAKASNVINKLSVDIQAASEHSQINIESQAASSSPLCKPSPSLPCLVGEDDEDAISTLGTKSIINNTGASNALCTTPQKLSKETLSLSPHIRDKQMISPLPKTPTTGNATRINADSNQKKLGTSTPTSSLTNSMHASTTPPPSSNGSSTKFDELNESIGSINSKSSPSLLSTACSKKKPEIFIPGFDGEIDERISESAVQSISAEFNTTLLDPSADEPKIPVESPPDASKQMEKLEESKSRVTISQEETESAVSALLGESFGNSSADYSLNDDDDGLDSLHTAVAVPESTIAGESEGPDEEAALAAKSIENEVASSAALTNIEEDSEEICKALQSLRQEEIEIKVDTPLSVRDLQIDTDAEENGEEVDSSGSHCLKIDETAHSNTSSITSDKQDVPVPVSESIPPLTSVATVTVQTSQSSVITKIELPTQTLPAESASQRIDKKMEYSNMSNVEKPSAHHTAQATVSSTDVSLVAGTVSTTTTAVSAGASNVRSSSVSYISSTPMKTAFTFSPAVTASSTPKQTQSISFKSMSSSQESSYVMQPPTISIPDSAHFAIPQMVLSPRGTINSHHTDTAIASSALPHSPQTSGTNMPQQSTVVNAYIMNTRTQSPHSPRQSSRGNTPIPRQPSPHTSTPPPVIQQQNIVIQRPMQSAVMSPPAVCTQNNSPVTSPSMGQSQRQPSPVGGLQKQSIQLHHQQLSPKASDQEQLTKIKNSSASSVGGSVLNVRSMQQQQEQPNSLYHTSKMGIEQHNLLAGQHMLPVSAQKLPAVPTHSTIISKVVTITPQQAQHSAQNVITSTCNVLPPSSTISQKPCKPIYSSTSTATGANSQRSQQQVMQQTSKTSISSQQSQSTPHSTQVMQSQSPQKQQHMQYTQAQRSQIQQHSPHRHQMQQHMLQIQQQQMIHQHQQKLQQQQQSLMSPSQSHSQSTVQQQQRLAGSPQQAQQTQSQQLQSNVIHSAQTPPRFVVQQHIVGVSSQQHSPQPQQPQSPVAQKQQQHHSQQQQPSQQQDRQFQIVQSKLQQAASPPNSLSLPKQSESEQSSVDSSKPIASTTNRAPQTSFEKSAPPSKENCESPSPLASTINKSSEGVSVICTSNPTTAIAPITKGPNSVATNLTDSARTAPLTEENVVKMSPIIQDEVEQDSKEDSDYWSAKEVNVETNVTSTVIKKVECVTIPQISTNKDDDKQKAKQSIDNEEKSKTSPSASKSESQNAHLGEQSEPIINTEAQTPASPFATAHNLSADNDTEDETETQQMPAFEQVHMSGGSKSGVRGTASKRGRQSRGSKKVGALSSASGSAVTVDGGSQQADVAMSSTVEISGIQTRLRKPVVTAPITRGRKGRPPRNLILQQQSSSQGNQQHSVQTAAAPNVVPTTPGQTPMPVLTAAEKKARNQAAAAALASLSEQQDVYEFHDDSGEENKLSSSTTNLTSSTTTTTDSRPRLILTIKSPAQAAQLVKTTEKSASDELPTVDVPSTTAKSNDGQNQETSPKVQSANAATNHTSQQDPLSTETTFANTRKSRRLLEKDRSTIDDIIEDVVRNNATNMALSASGQAACAINALPKGAQTPPRRSGRNATQPKKVTPAEVPTPANPIGRPRKSKERKANDGEAEQSSTQNSGTAIEASESEDGTAATPPATVLPKSLEQSTPSTPEKAQIHTAASQAPVTTTLPQHPKKKALAAAEIESYNAAVTAAAVTSTNTMPNLHSALPAGGVPMHNTAAPASQKTTGGAADSLNKPLIDSVTGVVSGVKMQQGKEGSLPLAAAASSLPIIAQTRGPMDPKKIMQAAVAAAAAENNQILPTTQIDNSKVSQKPMIQGAVATPVTALTKPVQAETAAAAAAAATSVATAMLNKSVSVVVKTSASPPIVMQQQIQVTSQSNHSIHIQQHNSQQQQISTQTSAGPATKQPLVVQQQNPVVMHAQQTNVKPPTSLKAHVLNSQKLQQQHQQQQQIIVNQNHSLPKPNGSSAQSQHVIQASIVTRQPIQQQQSAPKQLLVNIPPPSTHSPHGANVSSVNSPRLQSLSHQSGQQSQCQPQRHLQQQQQAIVIKQNQELHHSQVLHVVSSKPSASTQCKQSTPQILQQQQQQQANTQYNTYIQGSTSGQHVQQLQKSQTASTLHQQTASQQKPTSTSLTIPPGILGLPNHPAMIIQAKTTVPTQSPTGSTVTSVVANPHLQQVQHHHHTPSPPLQSQHLPKSLPTTNPLTHNLPSQSGPHVLTNASSASVGSKQQQQVPTPSNSAASIASIRTAAPAISPQGQSRVGSLLLPSGMQVPAHFDANTHEIGNYSNTSKGSVRSTHSPPPAHQQTTIPHATSDASYPGSGALRGVPTREHYMIYQQMLRSAQQDPLNSTTGLREYEENLMDNSPPLELRRPGSVPRTIAVPHSLQSPQDRATDSPQVAQVYVHNARIAGHAHYNTNANAPTGYYETTRQLTREPPPAHRSAAALPPTVVVPHPSASSSSPFIASVQPPPAPMQTSSNTSGVSGSLRIERERERECEREREHQLQREKEQILARVGDSHLRANTPPPPTAQMPPHSQPPQPTPQADSLLTLLQRYPVMWQGLLALKTDQAAVQMHFVFGNPHVARASLPCNSDGSTPPLRIAQRMRLEQTQLEGVARKMQFENEHCMLLALPCGRDHADVLQQSRNLQTGFITYLQQKMAAGIVNIPMPGSEQAAYVVHIFPSCDFANENLERAAPDLKNRVAELAHLLIVIATV